MEVEPDDIDVDDVETIVVDSNYAMKSAIELLISMSEIAKETSNAKLMSSAAAGWLEVHDRMEEEEEEQTKFAIGFVKENHDRQS